MDPTDEKPSKNPSGRHGAATNPLPTTPDKPNEAKELLESLAGSFDTTGSAIVWLDFRQRVVKSSEAAQHVLREAGVTYQANQPMVARNKRENRELQQVLRDALAPAGAMAAEGSVIVTRPNDQPPLVLRVTPIRGGDGPPASQVAALVMILDPQHEVEIDPGIVQKALGLTRAEAEVAVLLSQSRTVREIAKSTHREESTIRSHVKRTLAKRGFSRQMDLVLEVLAYGTGRRPR